MTHNDDKFSLLRTKRFLPFFISQFLGAFNDSAFKQMIVLLVSLSTISFWGMSEGISYNIIAVIFLLLLPLLS